MARTRNAVKRQKVATIESALFNPDVVFLLAALLDARDLCQVSLTCKTLGGKRANAVDGLSLAEEAAMRLFECASDWERSCLRKNPGEGWIELHHHLLMLRSKLTFDQLVGNYIQHGEEKSIVQTVPGLSNASSALCSNHVMRSGKHFTVFTGNGYIGVVRPVQIKPSDFGGGQLNGFYPLNNNFWEYLIGQRTARWTDSNVHCCCLSFIGRIFWDDWISHKQCISIDGYQRNAPTGLLLDLDEGTLSIYQNSQRVAILKDGLSGEYCWFAAVVPRTTSISIERGLAPGEQYG